MFHLISVWLTRIVVLGVLIALTVMYGIPKWFGDQAATRTPAAVSTERAAAAADKTVEASASPAAADPAAAEASKSAAPAGTASFPRCQPIGRTARGELVYSMDCRSE